MNRQRSALNRCAVAAVMAWGAAGCAGPPGSGAAGREGADQPVTLLDSSPSVSVGQQPNDVALADLNGDRYLDIVTANIGSQDISVLLGDETGQFVPAPDSPVPVSVAPHLLAAGDFDGDGNLDLALTSHDSNEVTVLEGDGKGGLTPMVGSPFRFLEEAQAHNHGLAVGDVNGDGNLDIATSNHDANSVSILLGDGRGVFHPSKGSPFRVRRGPYPLALGDVNRDGKLDLVTPDVGDKSVTLLLGDGGGGFAAGPGNPYRVQARPYFTTLGQLNDDGALDLVVSHDDSNVLSILLGDGKGQFVMPPRRLDVGGQTWKVRIADINGGGKSDLVMGTAAGGLAIFLGDGSGNFAPAPGSPFPVGKGPWGIAVDDLDHDGKLDVVTANTESNDVSVLRGRR